MVYFIWKIFMLYEKNIPVLRKHFYIQNAPLYPESALLPSQKDDWINENLKISPKSKLF